MTVLIPKYPSLQILIPQLPNNLNHAVIRRCEKMWFKPKDMKLTKSDTGDAMVFTDVSMELLTEATMQGQVITNPEGEAFASHMTSHYNEFADEFPVLKELKRLGKITSVVKWIKDNNIPLDLSFLNDYAITYVPTESYTPEISVTGTRSWWVGSVINIIIVMIFIVLRLDRRRRLLGNQEIGILGLG